MMQFTPNLLINVPAIDAQHQELFNRLNALVELGTKAVSKEETERILDFLGSYVVKHFGDEEVFQLQCGYPKHLWHHEQHLQFIETFKKLKGEYLKNGASPQFINDLTKSIIDWVVQHIRVADADIGKFVNSQKQ
jgi:hemerythrin